MAARITRTLCGLKIRTMEKKLASHSKFLSLILRHSPETIGIELDSSGWTDIDELIRRADASGRRLDHDTLLRVVHQNDKQRFAINTDGTRIRANQGHSVNVDLKLVATEPPEHLFHGTVEKFIDSIKEKGLISGERQHVHLSSDIETARIVARRRGTPVILLVRALEMTESGSEFYLSSNGVWLTDHVLTKFIDFPQTSGNAT